MEVHPPHGSVHSVKDFMVHLLAITIGLLIALGLESSVEWVHHRHLAQEARENILREIHDNQQSVVRELNTLPKEKEQLENILKTVSDMQYNRATKPIGNLTWTNTHLGEDAWNTSNSTGATSHMSYEEVKRYSRLYTIQALFNATAERYLAERGEMYAFLTRLNLPDRPSAAEFEQGKHAITSQIVMGQFLREISNGLNTNYDKISKP